MTEQHTPQLDELTDASIERGHILYSQWRDDQDQAIRIGLFDEDLDRAIRDTETIFITRDDVEGGAKLPVLVPVENLEWYNTELLHDKYGQDAKVLAYVHPPLEDEVLWSKARDLVTEKLDQGFIIITEIYSDDRLSPVTDIVNESRASGQYRVEAFGGEEESRVDVFAGKVATPDNDLPVPAQLLSKIYHAAIEQGHIQQDPENGTALEEVIEGEEAEEIWQIYEKPFLDLGHDDPTHAGFTKEQLLDILGDPEIAKIVNRVDGEITTLMFFLQKFDKAPWFNRKYYETNYPEYATTDNVFIFPGIVSDENKRGNNYSADVINLLAKLLAIRNSGVLVTFECTEVSTTYIPEIVTGVVNSGNDVHVSGLENPISVINYFALSKPKPE